MVGQIQNAGSRGPAVRADVAKPEEVRAMVAKAVEEEFGRLDVMVNNAGMEEKMPFLVRS